MAGIPVRAISRHMDQSPVEGFSIRDVGAMLGGTEMKHELHRHDFFFVLALEKGAGVHEIDFVEYEMADHSVFILRPGQVHQLCFGGSCTGYLMAFSNAFYRPDNAASRQRLRKAGVRPLCPVGAEGFARLKQILASIFREYHTAAYGFGDAIRASLDILFIELLRQSEHPGHRPDDKRLYTQDRFEEFQELLEENVATQKQASAYAALMSLSLFQLNKITRTAAGKSAAELINDHILLEAKRYLLGTAYQVKDIAYQLGFEDVSYFSRFFRKHTAHTPDAFRNNSR